MINFSKSCSQTFKISFGKNWYTCCLENARVYIEGLSRIINYWFSTYWSFSVYKFQLCRCTWKLSDVTSKVRSYFQFQHLKVFFPEFIGMCMLFFAYQISHTKLQWSVSCCCKTAIEIWIVLDCHIVLHSIELLGSEENYIILNIDSSTKFYHISWTSYKDGISIWMTGCDII